jgi:hypothetical protein
MTVIEVSTMINKNNRDEKNEQIMKPFLHLQMLQPLPPQKEVMEYWRGPTVG